MNSKMPPPAGTSDGDERKESMQEVIPFNYDSTELRVFTLDGEPWFVAKDVCTILGVGNVGQAIIGLDDDEKSNISINDVGQNGGRAPIIISESGLYSLIMRSRKPEARKFQRWVTHEVIPSIRKRGVYATEQATEAMLANPDVMIAALTELKAERAKRAEIEALHEAAKPKVIFADAVAASHTSILVGELAKILRGNGIEIGQNRLFAELRRDGFLIKREGSDWNMPTQRAMDAELFEMKETAITHSDGHVTVSKTPKVTGKGQQYFVNRYLRAEAA